MVEDLFQSSHDQVEGTLLRQSSDFSNPSIRADINKRAAGTRMRYERVRIDPYNISGPGAQSRIGRKRFLELLAGVLTSILRVGVARNEVHADGIVYLTVCS